MFIEQLCNVGWGFLTQDKGGFQSVTCPHSNALIIPKKGGSNPWTPLDPPLNIETVRALDNDQIQTDKEDDFVIIRVYDSSDSDNDNHDNNTNGEYSSNSSSRGSESEIEKESYLPSSRKRSVEIQRLLYVIYVNLIKIKLKSVLFIHRLGI